MAIFDVCLSLFADTALCQDLDSVLVSGQMQQPSPHTPISPFSLPSSVISSPGYKQMIALRRDKEA